MVLTEPTTARGTVSPETLILVLAAAGQTGCAQTPRIDAPEQPFKLSVTANLVLLDVSVRSAKGAPVSGLTQNSFAVYEDGRIQTLSHFAREDAPVTAGLVIDMSGSMRPKKAEVVAAALAFISGSNPCDEIFVVTLNDGVSLGLPASVAFTDDAGQLRSALWSGTPQGRTPPNDAIVFALGHLEHGRRDRRILVLVSDGGDNSSARGADDVMRAVLESRATIYTLGLFDADDQDRNPELLKHLARINGGESFLDVQLSDISGICGDIASDIRARYTIGYVPIRSGEQGSSRRIKVTASTPGGHKLVVHTRTRYVLPPARPLVDENDEPNRKPGL